MALHKDAPLPPACDHYVALGLGGFKPTTSLRALTDDVGESIVHKHRHYSELTGRTDPYQCRVAAFIAERFFTFYLHVIGARYVEVPVAITEMTGF